MEQLSPFLEFGTAGLMAAALIFVVIRMLKNNREEMAEERKAHGSEVDRMLESQRKNIETIALSMKDSTDRIIQSQRDTTKDLTAEIRLLRGELAEAE